LKKREFLQTRSGQPVDWQLYCRSCQSLASRYPVRARPIVRSSPATGNEHLATATLWRVPLTLTRDWADPGIGGRSPLLQRLAGAGSIRRPQRPLHLTGVCDSCVTDHQIVKEHRAAEGGPPCGRHAGRVRHNGGPVQRSSLAAVCEEC
jgi:hypothetical protein